jgi:phosphoserine phosphatase
MSHGPEEAGMISVIIPVLNESDTITSVVAFAGRAPGVSEVLVVDDGSLDGTPDLARAAGARVLTSTLLGKGASMEDGLLAAHNEVLLYLDGDLTGLQEDLIPRMTQPILGGEADFVKARFSRKGGRVTTLTAKPLLRIFFPELAHFDQPLAGIIAARRSLLRRLRFEKDYGVDVGLFLDAATIGAQLAEVDIGHLEHDSHPLEALEDMATQVARTVLDRAARCGRLHRHQVNDVQDAEQHRRAELAAVLQQVEKTERLALFDMDGVLLQGRFIVSLARRTRKTLELTRFLDNPDLSAGERTRHIAALFEGVRREVFERTALEMPLVPGASETVLALRKAGYRVGIVTDSYQVASEIVRRRVFADFSIAHLARFQGGRATGEVVESPAMRHPQGCPHHPVCKVNALYHLLERTGLGAEDVLAVGDGENDICLLRAVGHSVAFRPKTVKVQVAAAHTIQGALLEVLSAARERRGLSA